jgi:hypothetical protein
MFKGNTGNTLTRKVLAVLASQIFVTQQSVNLATSPTPMACEIYWGLVKFDI